MMFFHYPFEDTEYKEFQLSREDEEQTDKHYLLKHENALFSVAEANGRIIVREKTEDYIKGHFSKRKHKNIPFNLFNG